MKNLLLITVVSCGLLFTSCGGGGAQKETPQYQNTESNEEPAQVQNNSYFITNKNNERLVEIRLSGEGTTLIMPSGNLFGELKGDKRKYYSESDQFKYAVKFKEGAFKLRDSNEALLWKVKIYEDKIKISRSEEMTSAYSIYLKKNKIKVKKDDVEVSALRFATDEPFASINEKYTVRNFGNSLAMGILLIEDMSDMEKFIISTELLNRRR